MEIKKWENKVRANKKLKKKVRVKGKKMEARKIGKSGKHKRERERERERESQE